MVSEQPETLSPFAKTLVSISDKLGDEAPLLKKFQILVNEIVAVRHNDGKDGGSMQYLGTTAPIKFKFSTIQYRLDMEEVWVYMHQTNLQVITIQIFSTNGEWLRGSSLEEIIEFIKNKKFESKGGLINRGTFIAEDAFKLQAGKVLDREKAIKAFFRIFFLTHPEAKLKKTHASPAKLHGRAPFAVQDYPGRGAWA